MSQIPDPQDFSTQSGSSTRSGWLDVTSMGISGLCLAHCLALPLVFLAMPVLGQFSENHLTHQILILIAIPISIWALLASKGWKKPLVLVLAFLGLSALALAAFVDALHDYETPISVLGAVSVALAHYLNRTRHKA
jgi:uncharacterized membrane protein